MSINGVMTNLHHACWIMKWQSDFINPKSSYRPPVLALMLLTILLPHSENKHQRSVFDLWPSIMGTQTAVQQHQPIINVSAASIGKNASDDIAITS